MTSEGEQALVFDTGPLAHFAEAGWLSMLRSVAGSRPVLIPDGVRAELQDGLHTNPHLQAVLEAEWISVVSLNSADELAAFGVFAERLVVGTRNVGETEVLAYAKVHGATAVVDDGPGRRAANDNGVLLQPTLALIIEAIRNELLTVSMAEDLADHLLETEYRFPFKPGGFRAWFEEYGL